MLLKWVLRLMWLNGLKGLTGQTELTGLMGLIWLKFVTWHYIRIHYSILTLSVIWI